MERRSEMKNGIPRWEYLKCMPLYADINDIVANYTTLPPTTTTVTKLPVTEAPDPLLATVIGGSLGGFVFLCFVIICCLCISKRSEHKRRAEIEEQYKVVATTLTNITDSEDGCTYESLSMIDPTYRGEVELPTRKQRQRVDGVSNGLAMLKRWISVDGDSGSDGSMMPEYKRSQPLPAIPEPNGSKELAREIDEYTEIGSENIRSNATYFPLNENGESLSHDPNGNPYDRLRQSTLLSNLNTEVPNENMNKDDYFILEKPKRSITTENDNMEPSGPYFVLEKTSNKSDTPKSDPNVSENEKKCEPVEINNTKESSFGNDSNTDSNDNTVLDNSESNNKSLENSTFGINTGNSNPYFVLEKTSGSVDENVPDSPQDKALCDEPLENKNRPDSYIEPITRCNTYIKILPETKCN